MFLGSVGIPTPSYENLLWVHRGARARALGRREQRGGDPVEPRPHRAVPEARAEAKIFMFFPLFLTVILAPFPSGLVIYWTVNNILTMAQQVFIMKRTTVKAVT